MIRDRRHTTVASAWNWYLGHARMRFGASGWRVAQAAGRVVFDQRTPTHGTAGSVADLERQGLVRRTRRPRPGNLTATVPYRAVSLERLRDCGLNMAWGHDPLMSSSNHGMRVYRAQQIRQQRAQDAARRREVARGLAADRAAIEAGVFFTLTDAGWRALAEARA